MALWGLKVIPPSTSDPRSAILFICLHCAPGVPLRPAFRLRGRLKSRDGSRESALGRMARRERRASPAARPLPTFHDSPPPPRRAVRSEQRRQTAQSTLGSPVTSLPLFPSTTSALRVVRNSGLGGVAPQSQTAEEEEGKSGGRQLGEPEGMLLRRALPKPELRTTRPIPTI